MADSPNQQDWTWVLSKPCPECGLDSGLTSPGTITAELPALTAQWQRRLIGHPSALRRPSPGQWSPLEYGLHIRDVLILMRTRLQLIIEEDSPVFADWDQDEAAVAYGEVEVDVVGQEILQASAELTATIAAISGATWQRPGYRSDGAAFTAETLLQYCWHELVHHLYDISHLPDDVSSAPNGESL